MTACLGVDIGGTASRWVLVDKGGAVLARGSAGGATGHLFNPAERDKLAAVLAAIAAASRPYPIISAHFGITGYGEPVRADMLALIAAAMNLPSTAITLGDDMDLAFRAVFAPGAGHLISAGTGSIGLHLAADGTAIRVGGRGLLIDDGGSGTWIALTALDRLYREIDHHGHPGPAAMLAKNLFSAMGGNEWGTTRAYIYGHDRGRIGALAQAVARAADEGDPIALDTMERAGIELARLALALVARAGRHPIGFVGGIIGLHPSIKSTLALKLAGFDLLFPTLDAALSAAHLARIGLPPPP